jgi:hypothetical protein
MKINKGVITLARAGSLLPMLFEILVEVQASGIPDIILPSKVKSVGVPLLTVEFQNGIAVQAKSYIAPKSHTLEFIEIDIPREVNFPTWRAFLQTCLEI